MQLTAREWIELIADPEIREKALRKIETDPHMPNTTAFSMSGAITKAFIWDNEVSGTFRKKNFDSEEWQYWNNLSSNPPALLPIPNKEREQAEALLNEFCGFYYEKNDHCDRLQQDITDFLNQKYPS